MRFSPLHLLTIHAMAEVAALDSSGGGGGGEPALDVPALEEEGGAEALEAEDGEAREDGRDGKGRFKPKDAAPPPPPAKRKFTLKTKAGAEEVELSDEEVTQRLTRDSDSYRRYEEAAAERKAAAEERKAAAAEKAKVQSLLADPKALRAYLREHAGDKAHDLMVHALREELQERAREQNLDPRDAEIARLRRAEEDRQAAAAEAEEAKEREEAEAHVKAEMERARPGLQKAVHAALEKVGLPGDDRLARVVAFHYLVNKQHGIELSLDELARVAADELDKDLGVRTQGFTGAQVKQRYPHLYRAVHQDLLAQLKGRPQANAVRAAPAGADPLREEPRAPQKKVLGAKAWREL